MITIKVEIAELNGHPTIRIRTDGLAIGTDEEKGAALMYIEALKAVHEVVGQNGGIVTGITVKGREVTDEEIAAVSAQFQQAMNKRK